jgi:hypothetical protein
MMENKSISGLLSFESVDWHWQWRGIILQNTYDAAGIKFKEDDSPSNVA